MYKVALIAAVAQLWVLDWNMVYSLSYSLFYPNYYGINRDKCQSFGCILLDLLFQFLEQGTVEKI